MVLGKIPTQALAALHRESGDRERGKMWEIVSKAVVQRKDAAKNGLNGYSAQ